MAKFHRESHDRQNHSRNERKRTREGNFLGSFFVAVKVFDVDAAKFDARLQSRIKSSATR